MQQRHVVSCMAQHSFPHGLLLFADGKLVCILLFYPSCPFFKFNCCNKQVAQATCPIWPRTSAGRTKSTRICCCPEAVCLCPATELLSSAEGLCVSNKFLLPVYLHANLCVITVHDTGNRRVHRCPSLFLPFHPAFHQNYLLCPAGGPKGRHLSRYRAALILLRLYDDDTKVDLVVVVFSVFLFICVWLCFLNQTVSFDSLNM